MKQILLVSFLLILSSCNKNQTVVSEEEEPEECGCPHATIYLQPYGNFTEKEVESFLPALEENMGTYLYGGWEYKILKPKPIPFSPIVGKKYEAAKFLNLQRQQKRNHNEVIIGVTHEDICKDLHGAKNYGIVGLSLKPGNAAVVSDKRLKDKRQIWKPIIHEFMHAFYGADHCPKDDPTCFMKDAKGHGNFGVQNRVCDSCRQ